MGSVAHKFRYSIFPWGGGGGGTLEILGYEKKNGKQHYQMEKDGGRGDDGLGD